MSIGSDAFRDCPALQRVSLPSTLTTLNYGAFRGCGSLTDVSFSPDFSLDTLNSNLFSGCTSLTEITVPDSVTALKEYVFAGCSALQHIQLPDGLRTIENYCFQGCDQLAELTLPAGLTSVSGEAVLPGHLRKLVMADGIGINYVPSLAADELEELIAKRAYPHRGRRLPGRRRRERCDPQKPELDHREPLRRE